MSRHRYPARALVPDYLRSGAGFLLSGGPLLFADPSSAMVYVLSALAGLFFAYGVRTVVRQAWWVEVTDEGMITARPFRKTLRWKDVEGLRLRYFSTRRDRSGGWMELRLTGPEGTLRLESGLGGFRDLAARAADQAVRRGIELGPTTRANLVDLGVLGDSGLEEARPGL